MTSPKKIIVGASLAAVIAAAALWWQFAHKSAESLSATPVPAHPALATGATTDAMPSQKVDSVEVMAERLRARLAKEPNDVDGWVLLGRSYHYLERWDDAKAAFAKARALGYQGEDDAAAGVASATGAAGAASSASDAVIADIGRVAQGGDSDKAIVADSARVRVAVDIAPDVRKKFAPDTTVFIFARAAQGPRMPLAVVRKTLSELPAEIDLDDSLAMMPEAKISAAATIVLGARIAPSGNPIAQPGDIEALSAPLSNWRGQRVSLVLHDK